MRCWTETTCTHSPESARQMRPGHTRPRVPPRGTVVHQHAVGNATTLKGFFQLVLHRFAARAAVGRQGNQVAAVIVQHRQRPDRLRPSLRPFEIHLPQLIGLVALEALHGRGVSFLLPH